MTPSLDFGALLVASILFIVWLVRLESKEKQIARDQNGIGKKLSDQGKDITDIKIMVARIEERIRNGF